MLKHGTWKQPEIQPNTQTIHESMSLSFETRRAHVT